MAAQPSLNETDEYILDAIRKKVWSGFCSPEDVDWMIDDILEADANEQFLRDSVPAEFARKQEAEKTWPKRTECDLLDSAFLALDQRNILCLHNAGYEMSDGHQEAFEYLSDHPNRAYVGYCFYHGQDVEHAVGGNGLYIAFDHVNGDTPEKIEIGKALEEELVREGFNPTWDGSPNTRIKIEIEWRRRYSSGG